MARRPATAPSRRDRSAAPRQSSRRSRVEKAKAPPEQAVAPEWRELLLSLPGYDPFANAGDCWFDQAAAERALWFVEHCIVYTEGRDAGKPFAPSRFQRAIIALLFGFKCRDDNGQAVRRYREVLLYIPRGNGKTVFAAVLCLLILFCDDERGMQIYSAAASRDQAALLYRHAKGMIGQVQALAKRVRIFDATKSIVLERDPLSFYRPIAAEAGTSHGFKAHAAIIDEVHALPNRDLVDVLKTSMGTRTQPITIFITTADWLRESICNEVYDYAVRVRDGLVADRRFLPVIYEAAAEDDWRAEATWRKANPNLGVSVKLDFLREECQRARDVPAYENTFRRLYLNQRTEQDTRAIPMEAWIRCGHGVADPIAWRREQIARLKGRPCFAGLDLGSKSDLTALGLLFHLERPMVVLPYFWATRKAIKECRKRRVDYDLWERQGFLVATEGDVTDYDVVRRDVGELANTFSILEIAVDRLFQGVQLCTQLQGDGLTVIAFAQSFMNFAAPTRRLLELIARADIDHGGNPPLQWMAGNAATEEDVNGNLKFSKAKSTEKIDGIVALTMAIARNEARLQGSVYDGRGLWTVGQPPAANAKAAAEAAGEQAEPAKDFWDWDEDDDD